MKKLILLAAFGVAGMVSANGLATENVETTFFRDAEPVSYTFTSTCGKTRDFSTTDGELTLTEAWIVCQNLNVELCGVKFTSLTIEP